MLDPRAEGPGSIPDSVHGFFVAIISGVYIGHFN